ncbi:branched-chain amino acid ABC transporter permease [Pseudoroseomonas cervicalis]|uniref:branched-chain amino acid ABC transporter permease n=1 Tax=Teichococcus cervicalis TaxID=204525 RepID=UPI0035E47D95
MKPRDLIPLVLLLGALALTPLFASNLLLNFLVSALIIALGAQGWNLLGGYGGQLSFGHAALFGTGAYATAILQMKLGLNAWAGFAAGVALAALAGWVIGFLSFRARLRGSYFALVTLAFAEVLRILANAADFTGGAAGPADQAATGARQPAIRNPGRGAVGRAGLHPGRGTSDAVDRSRPLRRASGRGARE